jgi:hypothetical protein
MGEKKLVLTEEQIATTGHGVTGPKIRCPKCEWQPQPDDVWGCECGNNWHTFDTGGVCPSCIRQWPSTQCLSCLEWSAHSSWYDYA